MKRTTGVMYCIASAELVGTTACSEQSIRHLPTTTAMFDYCDARKKRPLAKLPGPQREKILDRIHRIAALRMKKNRATRKLKRLNCIAWQRSYETVASCDLIPRWRNVAATIHRKEWVATATKDRHVPLREFYWRRRYESRRCLPILTARTMRHFLPGPGRHLQPG